LSPEQQLFLDEFSRTGSIEKASLASRSTLTEVWGWRQKPEFDKAFATAKTCVTQLVEDAAFQLALKGNQKQIQLLLRAFDPLTYGDSVNLDVEKLTDAQLTRILDLGVKRNGSR
jgi:hypothetical protein